MQCKKCGTEIKDGCLFCHNCGEEVQIVPDFEPELDDFQVELEKDEDVSVQENTGSKTTKPAVTEEETSEKKAEKPGNSKGWLFFFVLFLLSTAAFWVAYTSVLEHQEPDEMIQTDEVTETEAPVQLSAPEFGLPGGEYGYYISIAITAKPGETIYYTLDATMPDETSKIYREPIELSEGITVVRAFVMDENGNCSDIVSEVYQVEFGVPDPPVIIPASGEYTGEQYIKVIVPEGYLAYYTLDGTEPSDAAELYTGEFLMPEGTTTVSVILINDDGSSSEISTVVYHRTVM